MAKDKTWGGYYVTRVSNPGHPINLEDALVLSDNIYFAQTALDMGADQYIKGLTKFGFGEEIPYIYPLKPSQISNDGKFKNDILLADSSYGQGEVQTNIVHLAAGYTAFINDGNIIKPILLTEEKRSNLEGSSYRKNTAKIINDSLRQVVASPRGRHILSIWKTCHWQVKRGLQKLLNRDKENKGLKMAGLLPIMLTHTIFLLL